MREGLGTAQLLPGAAQPFRRWLCRNWGHTRVGCSPCWWRQWELQTLIPFSCRIFQYVEGLERKEQTVATEKVDLSVIKRQLTFAAFTSKPQLVYRSICSISSMTGTQEWPAKTLCLHLQSGFLSLSCPSTGEGRIVLKTQSKTWNVLFSAPLSFTCLASRGLALAAPFPASFINIRSKSKEKQVNFVFPRS